MNCALTPDTAARVRDELCLTVLNCWDQGWSGGEIEGARLMTRCAAIAFVHRVFEADPDALRRRPPRTKQARAA